MVKTKKLEQYYGDKMIAFQYFLLQAIITFKERSHDILRESWKTQKLRVSDEKKVIIQTVASYIRDSLRSKPYPLSTYPCMSDISQKSVDSQIPGELKLFLDEVIKSKTENELTERRKCAIADSMISACCPRSFVSILLRSLSTYIHRKHGSRDLIDLLSSLGSAQSYHEVLSHQWIIFLI